MRKFTNFKPSLITREFFPGYDDPSVINEGECFIWAYLAHLMFRDVEIWYVDCHAFVRHRGRFYDSETLKGSTEWADLPATGDATCPPKKVSANLFKKHWNSQPRRFNTSWGEIEARARRVLKREQR